MAGHAQLKFVITECSKTQIRLTGLKLNLVFYSKFQIITVAFSYLVSVVINIYARSIDTWTVIKYGNRKLVETKQQISTCIMFLIHNNGLDIYYNTCDYGLSTELLSCFILTFEKHVMGNWESHMVGIWW